MAGDLFIENLPDKAFYFLMAVAGESGFHKQVHHANRSWADNSNRLTEQLIQPTQNRENLPPHAYIELNRSKVESFLKIEENKTGFGQVASRLLRPLGVVSDTAALKGWDGAADKSQELLTALEKQNIIIEYYKVGGQPLMERFESDNKWEKVDEKTDH